MMRHQKIISLGMALALTTCVFLGAIIGAGSTLLFYSSTSSDLSIELNQKTQRLILLESLLHQMSKSAVLQIKSSANPESIPPSISVSPNAPAQLAQTSNAALSAGLPVPSLAPTLPSKTVTSNSTAIERVERLSTRPASGPISAEIPPLRKKTPPVGSAIDTGNGSPVEAINLETLSAAKVGVKFLFANGVLMHNGKIIRLGDAFPSGERLMQIDLDNNRVLTSERHISLVFNQE